MIRLPEKALPEAVGRQLERWQAEVDALGSHAEQVAAAKKRFHQRNTPRNRTFVAVRRHLLKLCSGAMRCGYCEDSAADAVEHIWPKDLYPEWVFAWRNYLYACRPCNGPKSNRFAVFPPRGRKVLEVGRTHRLLGKRPPPGESVFIDPRSEDPMELLDLDLRGTFHFVPRAPKGTRGYARADYTLNVLRLNREVLVEARMDAFASYRARLVEYVWLRVRRAPAKALRLRVHAIQRAPHPTVWREMQRSWRDVEELQKLFRKAPEALEW